MAGPTGRGPPRRQTPSTATRADETATLVPLGPADARWPPLVPSAPPAKEREPPDAAWTVVARRGRHCATSAPPPATAVEQGRPAQRLQAHKPPPANAVEQALSQPPPATAVEQAVPRASTTRPPTSPPHTPTTQTLTQQSRRRPVTPPPKHRRKRRGSPSRRQHFPTRRNRHRPPDGQPSPLRADAPPFTPASRDSLRHVLTDVLGPLTTELRALRDTISRALDHGSPPKQWPTPSNNRPTPPETPETKHNAVQPNTDTTFLAPDIKAAFDDFAAALCCPPNLSLPPSSPTDAATTTNVESTGPTPGVQHFRPQQSSPAEPSPAVDTNVQRTLDRHTHHPHLQPPSPSRLRTNAEELDHLYDSSKADPTDITCSTSEATRASEPVDYKPSDTQNTKANIATPKPVSRIPPPNGTTSNVVSPTPHETAKDAPTPQPTQRSPSSSSSTSKPSTSHAHENAPPPLPAPSDGTVEHIFRNILLCEQHTIANIKHHGITDFSGLLNADPNDFVDNSILYHTEAEMWTLLQKVARVQQWNTPSDVLAFQEENWDALNPHWIDTRYEDLCRATNGIQKRVRFENATSYGTNHTNRHSVSTINTLNGQQPTTNVNIDNDTNGTTIRNERPDASPDNDADTTAIHDPDCDSNGQHHDGDSDTSEADPTHDDAYLHGFDEGFDHGTAYTTGYNDGFSDGHDARLVSDDDNSDEEDDATIDNDGDY